jgi:hypothetical protein
MRYGSLKFWRFRLVDRCGVIEWRCYNSTKSLINHIKDVIGKYPLSFRLSTKSGYHIELLKPQRKNLREIICMIGCLEKTEG